MLEVIGDKRLERIADGTGYVTYYDLARIYSMLGDANEAVRQLQIAVGRGWLVDGTEMVSTDPMLENIREDPAFLAQFVDGIQADSSA